MFFAYVKHKCILIMYIFLFLYTARNVHLEHDTEKQFAMADAATAAIRMNRAVLARFDIAGESNVTSKNGCVFPSKLLWNESTQPRLKSKTLVMFEHVAK